MRTAPHSRIVWSCAALFASVVATLAADRVDSPAAEPPAPIVPLTCWSENFDGVAAPQLTPGWTSFTQSGTANPWTTIATAADTAPNRTATGNPPTISDNYLVSPVIAMPPGSSTLSFRNSFDTEAGFDGGVLEISINGAAFADIVTAGGSFAAGGYNTTLNGSFGNPLGGRQAWSGNSGGFITTTVNMPAAATSQNVRLRWRMTSDLDIAAAGWSIDTMTIAAAACGSGALPGAFSKIVPEDAAPSQSSSPTLMWAASTGAVSYEYCIDTTNDNACSGWTGTGANTSVALGGLLPATIYYWHVRATNPGGTTYANGSATAFWRFTTQALPPGAFSRTSPLGGATNRFTTLTLNWTASSGAVSYEYCIDTSNDGTCSTSWVSTGTSRTVTLTGLNTSTAYSWHVRAVNDGGTAYADGNPVAFIAFTTAPISRAPFVDLDGDGTGDALVQEPSTGKYWWQRYQPGGGFLQTQFTQGTIESLVTLRNDTDARTDAWRFNSSTGAWSRLINNGTTFLPAGNSDWWPGWQRYVLDLNGDGISDFFLFDPPTGVWFQCTAGVGCYQGGWNPGWEIYAARLNNDDFGDFFLINRKTGRWFWALGTGPATSNFTYPVSEVWFKGWKIYHGDFNGDGLTDLLLHDPDSGMYFVASSTGSGFTYVQGGWSLGWTPIVADLNGDGMDDLFLHDATTGNWAEMISNGAGVFTNVGMGTWSLGWQIQPTDFDGDGRADFLLYHPQTGVWYQARNTGPGAFAYTSGMWNTGLLISTGAIGR
jgi:hypothetical protein